jgi:hypothetical protein
MMQRIIDSAIPIGTGLAMFGYVTTLVPLPETALKIFYSHGVTYAWALTLFLSVISISIGVWMKPKFEDLYYFFEYPGLILASSMLAVWAGAIVVAFGFGALLSTGLPTAIAVYFFVRWLVLHKSLKKAQINDIRR